MPFQFRDQDRRPGLHYSCSVCQPQNMAAIPTFTGDGGPILSLTGKQRTEYALVGGGGQCGCIPGSFKFRVKAARTQELHSEAW